MTELEAAARQVRAKQAALYELVGTLVSFNAFLTYLHEYKRGLEPGLAPASHEEMLAEHSWQTLSEYAECLLSRLDD